MGPGSGGRPPPPSPPLVIRQQTNVLSRISCCDKRFAGVWLTKSSQISESRNNNRLFVV